MLNVRQGRPEDAETVLKVFADRNTAHDYPDITVSKDEIQAKHVILLIAEDDNDLCGFVLAYDLVTWCYLDTIVVKNNTRGKGIGKALLNALRTKSTKWDHISTCVHFKDPNTTQWFSKQGFQGEDHLIWKFQTM